MNLAAVRKLAMSLPGVTEEPHFDMTSFGKDRGEGLGCAEGVMIGMPYGGLWGLIVLVADIWAIVNVIQSNVSTNQKILWVVIVALLPVVGVVLWFVLGPKSR